MLRSDHGCAHSVTLTSRILDGMCALWCRDMCRGPCGTVRAAAQSTRSPDASRYTHALQTYTPATWRHCARVDISTGSVCRQQPRDGAQPMALPMDHERNVCHQACALVAAWQSQEPTYCCVVRIQASRVEGAESLEYMAHTPTPSHRTSFTSSHCRRTIGKARRSFTA